MAFAWLYRFPYSTNHSLCTVLTLYGSFFKEENMYHYLTSILSSVLVWCQPLTCTGINEKYMFILPAQQHTYLVISWYQKVPGGCFDLTIPSYQCIDSYYKDKMAWKLSHLNNGNPYTRKDILYWDETHSISRKGTELVFCSFSCLCSITFHKVHYCGYLLLSLTKRGIDQTEIVGIENQHNEGNY